MENTVIWDKATQEKFDQLLSKIPVFLRSIAQDKVSRKVQKLLKEANRTVVEEKDLVDAFFSETPFGFHGPMKNDMREFGIDYTKYGYSN